MRHIGLIGIQLHGNDAAMLRGVFRFARQRSDWVIHDAGRPAVLAVGDTGGPCGLIANIVDAGVAARCRVFGVPVVNVSGPMAGLAVFPTVSADNAAVGWLAAEHLAGCGLRSFAWFNHMVDFPFIARRGEGFAARLRERGFSCAVFNEEVTLTAHASGRDVDDPPPGLSEWLVALPRPCGVFSTTDHGGRELCWLCRQLGLNVPEDVAVVGVDDFEFICETSHPPLSSVRLPNEEIGYRAAELLDALLAGGAVPDLTEFPPLGVRVRQSSDVIAVEDRSVAAALAHIRRNATTRLDVATVARTVGVNRRSLERRFRATLDRTVLQEIHAAMVTRSRQLLVDTDLPIGEVAVRAGFRDAQHLDLVFRKVAGSSPSAFRRQARSPTT
jgi:LacI family transcriptional regulator